jgi:hypothetical protein
MLRRCVAPAGVLVACLLWVAPAFGAGFGVSSFEASDVNANGTPDVQAGSHPFVFTTSLTMNEPENQKGTFVATGGGLKDLRVQFPPGFVGNPNAVPKCPYYLFQQNGKNDGECPNDTVVGEATVRVGLRFTYVGAHHVLHDQERVVTAPLYNVEPPGGVAVELGFFVDETLPVLVDASVRTGEDYGVTVTVSNIVEALVLTSAKVKVWGVPANPSHDPIRGLCLAKDETNSHQEELSGIPHNEEETRLEEEIREGEPRTAPASCPAGIPAVPFLTNPGSCGKPFEVALSVDGWSEPGNFITKTATLPELTGCEHLDFSPGLTTRPESTAASTPSGLNVGVHLPQDATSDPVGSEEADVRNATVALPEGMQLSPAAADGLASCPLLRGREAGQEERERQHEVVGVDLESAAPANCPDSSKVANVRIKTPLLEHELAGFVFLAAPQNFAGALENPFGTLFALYLVAEEPATGILVKVAGKVSLNEQTGQVTTSFENTPQLPFEDLKLEFYGASRAALTTPAHCGTYATTSAFMPWSASTPVGAGEVKEPSAHFEIKSGPGGGACPGSVLPFSPSLAAGSTNIQAGAFAPFAVTIGREDGQQPLQAVQLHMPQGLLGILTGIKLCPEAQANAGTCGPESLIGETTVSAGLGGDPLTIAGGKVYLTERFEGAPFGLSIVNQPTAGPFTLQEGRPVVVRAKVEVDPHNAALTVTSATGAHGIPSIIDGVPLQLKHVNVTVNRPGFTFNPTSCNPAGIAGTIQSTEGAVSPVSVPFQVTNCAALAFKPRFTVATPAKASKATGAGLTVALSFPSAGPQPSGQTGEANVAKVAVSLPKQLPARLTTIQQACPEATYNQNPASCPTGSDIGTATAKTPVFSNPLTGPAYLVSHGGAAFPNLVMILQGEGVTIDLVGSIDIKHGITSSAFETVPDAPVSSFQLTLPQGPHSGLAANLPAKAKNDFCGQKLTMPTTIAAQNGAQTVQQTKVTISGCPKAKKKAHKAKKHHKGKKQ